MSLLSVVFACTSVPETETQAQEEMAVVDIEGADPETCRLAKVNQAAVDIGAPRDQDRLKTQGTVRVGVLFGTYADGTPQRTPEQVFDMLSPGAEQTFADMSYGRMEVLLEPHLTWLPLAGQASEYAQAIISFEGHRDFLAEGVALSDAEVDFSQTNLVLLVGPPSASQAAFGPTWTGFDAPGGRLEADGNTILNGVTSGADLLYWGSLWLNHEMGHSLSLPDL
jgi:hypothetical protein